eukprot:jgi/Chrzof1/15054/Cz09g25130.t1
MSGEATSTTQGPEHILLPPKQRYQLSRKRPADQGPADDTAPSSYTHHLTTGKLKPNATLSIDPYRLLDEDAPVPEQSSKQLRISTSKIQGTAQPHKPRIGPEYQALLPALPAAQQRPAATASNTTLPFADDQQA